MAAAGSFAGVEFVFCDLTVGNRWTEQLRVAVCHQVATNKPGWDLTKCESIKEMYCSFSFGAFLHYINLELCFDFKAKINSTHAVLK